MLENEKTEKFSMRDRGRLLFLKEPGVAPGSRIRPEGINASREDDGEAWFVCGTCGRGVARYSDWRGEGSRRTCANPHGLVFEISLFHAAPGCVAVGEKSGEFSWYPGHLWRAAICGGCAAHLGWRFEGESLFWGLIEGALRLTGAPEGGGARFRAGYGRPPEGPFSFWSRKSRSASVSSSSLDPR